MDIFNLIRAGIFIVAGLICIIFRERLNAFKNRMLKKFHFDRFVKDERRDYIYVAFLLFVIAIIFFILSMLNISFE